MTAYTIKFSDLSKTSDITVPDMPPGINTVDTSLALVGKGYPNYGLKVAENFVHLLENFSGPQPPQNPIEGQLWYDTSVPTNKILRIMDGTAGATRWPNANGIYQQGTDPKDSNSSGLKVGDVWVDTANNQLKIFNSNDWTLVGPLAADSVTGPVPEYILGTDATYHWIIKNIVDSTVISVISADSFTPRQVIAGFPTLKKGVNLINTGLFNGTSIASQNLEISGSKYAASTLLRKNDQSSVGQVITGKVIFQTPTNQSGAQGRDGLVINTGVATEYVQLYKIGDDAALLNNKVGGKIFFQVRSGIGSTFNKTLVIDNGIIGINKVPDALSPALDVEGSAKLSGIFTVTSTVTNAINVAGGIVVGKDVYANGITVTNTATLPKVVVGVAAGSGTAIVPATTGTYDLGSADFPFRSLYVANIGTTGTIISGSITGTAGGGLEYASTFKLQGQVTATSFLFAGTGTEATFNAMLTSDAINSQTVITVVEDTSTLLVSYQGDLAQIKKKDFLSDISFTGMIVPYGGLTPPTGWLECNGTSYSTSTYSTLYTIIKDTYGLNLPGISTIDSNSNTVKYIIKT